MVYFWLDPFQFNNMNDEIEFEDKEVDEFYERFGGTKFALQSEVARAYGDRKIDIYFKSIGFAATVISTIGIIAGFGFTAFGYVESRFLFFVGEGILLFDTAWLDVGTERLQWRVPKFGRLTKTPQNIFY